MREVDFDRLFREHAQGLFGFLVYRTGDRALAEDVLSEAFERAIRGRRGFDRRKAREKTWLYTIASNCLTDRQRRASAEARALEKVAPAASDAGPAPEDEIGDRDALSRAMASLAPEESEAVALRFGGDLSMAEVARVTGQSVTTAEGRVYRGLRKLRQAME